MGPISGSGLAPFLITVSETFADMYFLHRTHRAYTRTIVLRTQALEFNKFRDPFLIPFSDPFLDPLKDLHLEQFMPPRCSNG